MLQLMRSLQSHWIFSMSQQVLKAPRPMLQLRRQFKLQIGSAQNPERTTKTPISTYSTRILLSMDWSCQPKSSSFMSSRLRLANNSEIPTIPEWPLEQTASKERGMPMMPEVSVQQRYQIFDKTTCWSAYLGTGAPAMLVYLDLVTSSPNKICNTSK